ncbi:hypothetical protein DL771_005356 [Monosporascus sp. 5C6A]|nr:hypothetical protein DL771_005356 [Monosporascus sp. 5C6A]
MRDSPACLGAAVRVSGTRFEESSGIFVFAGTWRCGRRNGGLRGPSSSRRSQSRAAAAATCHPAADAEHDEYARLLAEVHEYFTTRHRFRGGREIGSGAYGAAIAYTETLTEDTREGGSGNGNGDAGRRNTTRRTRKVIVKVAFNADSDASIANEAAHLAAVRGAEHIVRLLYEGPTAARELSRRTLVEDLEEHGDWETILGRFIAAGRRVPNRILWGVFLCLTRAVIGMAYPRGADANAPPAREEMQEGRAPSTLAHQDITLKNTVVGSWDRTVPERRFSPITKAINRFRQRGFLPADAEFGDRVGYLDNIDQIGRAMLWLAIGHRGYEIEDAEIPKLGDDDNNNDDGDGDDGEQAEQRPPALRTIQSRTHPHLIDGSIAEDLRTTIRRCRAADRAKRPGLGELLRICLDAVVTGARAAAEYAYLNEPAPEFEADHMLDWLIQAFILNGDETGPVALAGGEEVPAGEYGGGGSGDIDMQGT